MSNIRSEFGNLKGHQVETARKTLKFENRHYYIEAHGIQDRKSTRLNSSH